MLLKTGIKLCEAKTDRFKGTDKLTNIAEDTYSQ